MWEEGRVQYPRGGDRGSAAAVFHVEVEVKDINDNPPVFPVAIKTI